MVRFPRSTWLVETYRARGKPHKTILRTPANPAGEVRGQVIPKLTKRHVQPGIHENAEAGSKLYTDSGSMYKGLDAHYDREWVMRSAFRRALSIPPQSSE